MTHTIPDGTYRVDCTIHSLHGQDQPPGVLPLVVANGKAKVVISSDPATGDPREYLEVNLTDLFPLLSPQGRADYTIPELLDGRRLKTDC